MKIIDSIIDQQKIAVLIDPEKCQSGAYIEQLIEKIHFSGVDFIFIGGSTVSEKEFNQTIAALKN
jgi:heptaprenylglyceryl phosphate synthase